MRGQRIPGWAWGPPCLIASVGPSLLDCVSQSTLPPPPCNTQPQVSTVTRTVNTAAGAAAGAGAGGSKAAGGRGRAALRENVR